MNKEIKFVERIDDQEFGKTFLYFEAPKEFIVTDYKDVEKIQIQIAFPINKIQVEYADICWSPVINGETIDFWGCHFSEERISQLITLSEDKKTESIPLFKSKIRCNFCDSVFYEEYVEGTDECPVCKKEGCLMDVPKDEFPQYYNCLPIKPLTLRKGKNAYPILGKCYDFEKLLKELEDEDLVFIETTLKEYEEGKIDFYINLKDEYIFVEDNYVKFGGIKLDVLKWVENKITTDELISNITTLPF